MGVKMSEPNNEKKAVERIFENLPAEEKNDFINSFLGMIRPALETAVHDLMKRGQNVAMEGLIKSLAALSHESSDEVLKKALNLYRFVLEARKEGNRVAILNPDDEIVHEVVGFEPTALATPPQKVAG